MKYISTRGEPKELGFEDVLLKGLAPDGGLYVPLEWPSLDFNKLDNEFYWQDAAEVLLPFVSDFINKDDLNSLTERAYKSFERHDMTPLIQLDDNKYLLELFHGPTLAFKDFAMLLLAELFDVSLKKRKEKITIIGATSGDTGSAAIEAFKNSKNVNVFIFFPKDRVSEIQRKQMTTTNGDGVFPVEIDGTFDDCQNIVKSLFNDLNFNDEVNLGAINSINWGRIAAQIVYYFTSYKLLKNGPISYSVPTGNFGDILAGWAAKKMGLPIANLLIATNENDILARALETGVYSIDKAIATMSPSMDIQISSNFERLLFEAYDRDSSKIKSLMNNLKENNKFIIDDHALNFIKKDFIAKSISEKETKDCIANVYKKTGYILDPHTAVGYASIDILKSEGSIVTLGTAHPSKFPKAVKSSLGKIPEMPERLKKVMSGDEIFSEMSTDLEKIKEFIRFNT
ncbi:threonine synthase [Rhodobiaceae bacterium]|nr:threonine synthase [Rhodobiaceae bacterium]